MPYVVRRRLRVPALAAVVLVLPLAGAGSAEAAKTKWKPALTSGSSGGSSIDRYHHLGSRALRRGLTGHDVKVAQDYLRRAGFSVHIDGDYGPGTVRAVRQFEVANGRRPDGRLAMPDIDLLRGFVERGGHVASVRNVRTVAATADQAGLNPDGTATAPEGAPPEVAAIIAAGNRIAFKPYHYGGGHAYMVVAGLRFDTSGRSSNGTRWQADMRSPSGYTIRHPAGL